MLKFPFTSATMGSFEILIWTLTKADKMRVCSSGVQPEAEEEAEEEEEEEEGALRPTIGQNFLRPLAIG